MSNALPGSLLGVKINGVYYRCQTAADLTFGSSTTSDDACKPDQGAGLPPLQWATATLDEKNWTITFSMKNFADGLAASGADLINFFVTGNLLVEARFLTNTNQGVGTISSDWLFIGSGYLSGLKVNAPAKGASTSDVTITGNGTPSWQQVNRTT